MLWCKLIPLLGNGRQQGLEKNAGLRANPVLSTMTSRTCSKSDFIPSPLSVSDSVSQESSSKVHCLVVKECFDSFGHSQVLWQVGQGRRRRAFQHESWGGFEIVQPDTEAALVHGDTVVRVRNSLAPMT
jgi:hypothetical protein